MSWEDVGSVADLERDGHVVARVGGREIGVVAVNGELRGVRNRCPHHGGPLCLGTVRERVAGDHMAIALEIGNRADVLPGAHARARPSRSP